MGVALAIAVVVLCLGLAEMSRWNGQRWTAWGWTCAAALNTAILAKEILRFKGLIP